MTKVAQPALELRVVQLNIGEGHNKELMEKCPLLAQYAQYVGRVQKYAKKMPLTAAVERAVDECIKEGILADFLRRNRAEAIEVSIFEYDEERELELFREAEREVAREEGLKEGRKRGLEDINELLRRMIADGRSADIERMTVDKSFQDALLKEYGLL